MRRRPPRLTERATPTPASRLPASRLPASRLPASRTRASRPDPRRGVFETMLIAGRRAPHRAQHLRRLCASVAELYGASLPENVSDRIEGAASRHDLGRLRVTAVPDGETLACEVEASALPAGRGGDGSRAPATVGIASLAASIAVVPGGIGPHKWLDRRLLDALEAARPPRVATLLIDLDGCLLEATRANVFVLCGSQLLTPPLDGRILPGTARRRLIEHARGLGLDVCETAVHRSLLAEADAVLLTNAIRGVMRVSSVEGVPTSTRSDLAARLCACAGG